MALRHANRKFMRGSVERHVARWVGRQYAVLPLAAMHLCRGKTDWPCGVQTVSSRTAQWSGMWPSGLAGKMLCWPLAAMRLYRGKTDWPCSVQAGSSRAAQWAACGPLRLPGMMQCWPLAAMRLCREWACAGVRLIGLAACKPEAHARLSGAACGPLRLPGMMPCWPLSAMRLCLEYNYAGNGPVPGVRPIGLAACKPEVHARLSGRHVARCVCPA